MTAAICVNVQTFLSFCSAAADPPEHPWLLPDTIICSAFFLHRAPPPTRPPIPSRLSLLLNLLPIYTLPSPTEPLMLRRALHLETTARRNPAAVTRLTCLLTFPSTATKEERRGCGRRTPETEHGPAGIRLREINSLMHKTIPFISSEWFTEQRRKM